MNHTLQTKRNTGAYHQDKITSICKITPPSSSSCPEKEELNYTSNITDDYYDGVSAPIKKKVKPNWYNTQNYSHQSHTAWLTAASPTRMSSPLYATQDGVVLAPMLFSSTSGRPLRHAATHEYVVPRSIPTAQDTGAVDEVAGVDNAVASAVRCKNLDQKGKEYTDNCNSCALQAYSFIIMTHTHRQPILLTNRQHNTPPPVILSNLSLHYRAY